MRQTQDWQVGAMVKVGFVADLHVHEKVASPGNYRPDGYVLSRGEQVYAFVPHDGGLRRAVDFAEARRIIQE